MFVFSLQMYKYTNYIPNYLYKLYVKLYFYTINTVKTIFLKNYFVSEKKCTKFAKKKAE